ncbi:MAG TPA: GxxExxY protein [Candidatus Limnocylindria bacterium]|nr:GxxExxY protein [Candidatus Limnocylindria bacterium]
MNTLQKTTEVKIQRKREFLFGDITYKVNGILIEVYKELGSYAREKQYADLVEHKLKARGIAYKREVKIGDSGNIVDFIIEDKIILELKAKPFLIKEHFDQVKRYLYQTNLQLGILVNFRTNYLNPKRVLSENFK